MYNQISGHVITITTGVDNQHHVGAQIKSPMDKSTIGQTPQRIKIKADKTPKRGNILVRQQSRCTIPFLVMWSRSQQVWTINITWAHREKENGQKHDRTKAPKDKNQSGQNPQKMEYFSTPTIKVYNPIFWSCDHFHNICGQSTSRGRTEKSPNGQKHHRTKTSKDKNQSGQNP